MRSFFVDISSLYRPYVALLVSKTVVMLLKFGGASVAFP